MLKTKSGAEDKMEEKNKDDEIIIASSLFRLRFKEIRWIIAGTRRKSREFEVWCYQSSVNAQFYCCFSAELHKTVEDF